jgi:hypothetical protein
MPKNWKLIHIKSKQRGKDNISPKLPTSDQLEYGEIAINYGDGIETIAIKNENDEIIKFVPEYKMKEYIVEAMEDVVPKILKLVEEKIDTLFLPENDTTSIDSGEY